MWCILKGKASFSRCFPLLLRLFSCSHGFIAGLLQTKVVKLLLCYQLNSKPDICASIAFIDLDKLFFRFIFVYVMLKAAISFVSPWHSLSLTSECSEDYFFPREFRSGKNFGWSVWHCSQDTLIVHHNAAGSYHDFWE